MATKPKRIVVDASVARSAGSSKTPGDTSSSCREVLIAVQECHRVAFSQAGTEEWRRHWSSFARGWYASMVARRKVDFVEGLPRGPLRQAIEVGLEAKDRERRLMLEDVHLLEAALEVDRIVVSRDETVRGLFRRLAALHVEVGTVLWGNPEIEEEAMVAWLRDGARVEEARTLGS